MSEFSEILPGLYIGNEKNAIENILDFDLIVNCTTHVPFSEACKNNFRINIIDDQFESFPLFQILRDSSILKDINNYLNLNQKVLVHCQAGAQRSPAVVACYLIMYHDMTPTLAIEFIKNKRKIAFFWFVNFEKTLELMYKYHIDNV